jgi:predicted RNA-binding Zn-ribbon protein involved in translation (DUF1610 family)
VTRPIRAPECPACGVTMQAGFLQAHPLRSYTVEWVAGKPATALRRIRKPRPLVAWRCPDCGTLQQVVP